MAETDRNKRPKFSAPVPPSPKADVVENQDKHPVTDTVVVDDPATVSVDTGSPSPKVVSRDPASQSNINDVLAQTTSTKVPPPPTITTKPAKEGSNCNAILVGIATFSFIIGIAGWILYFNSTAQINLFNQGGNEATTEALTPSPVPSPTMAAVDRSAVKLGVLNGSGVAGAAGSTADTLEGLGYTIQNTGNADNSDYTVSEVYTTEAFAHTDLLLADLEEEFGPASVSGTLEDSEADTRIIVGKDWAD